MVYSKTDKLNFLVYSLLSILLVNADRKVILKTYVGVKALMSYIFIVTLKVNKLINIVGVLSYSFGFIYPTDFAAHCFYLHVAILYLAKDGILAYGP